MRSDVVLGALAIAMVYPSTAAGLDWQQRPVEEVEFAVTATVSGATIPYPAALESGYDGAWVFGSLSQGAAYVGAAQTFSVPSSRTLNSVQLRVGLFDSSIPTGQFEVAIHRFDVQTGCPAEKLVSLLANANAYQYPAAANVPASAFDFASFNLTLKQGDVYALVVTPTATFTGGNLTLQAATNIYAGGSAYILLPGSGACLTFGPDPIPSVPTLSPWLLIGLNAILVALAARNRGRGAR